MLGNGDDEQKPLFRKWYKQAKQNKREDFTQIITKLKLSSSEEWILIETDECMALLNAESKVGSTFWKNLQSFDGQGLALKIFPVKGKLGFDIDFHENVKRYYIWEDETLHVSEKKSLESNSATTMTSLTWENAQKKLEKQSSKASKTTTKKSSPSVTGTTTSSNNTQEEKQEQDQTEA